MKRTRSMLFAIVISAIVVIAAPLAAQGTGENGPSWISTTYVTVKPEMDNEFQDLIKNHWLPAAKKTDVPFTHTWRVARFGDVNLYAFVSPIESFAQLDGEPPMMKVMKGAEYERLYARLRQCVTEVRSVAEIMRPDVGFDKLEGKAPKMAVVSYTRIKPGQSEEYARLLKEEWLPPVAKLDYPAIWSSQTVFGGASNEWVHVTAIENFAQIDKGPPLERALGREAAGKILARINALVESDRMIIAVHLPELSYNK